MSKKIILIIGILVVIGVALFLGLSSTPTPEGESRVGFSLREFLPFGQSNEPQTPFTQPNENENNNSSNVPSTNQPIPRLRKISSEPVAGAVIFNTGTTSVVRFVEKGTGNVYEATSNSNNIQRLTNTTIPKIMRAFWLPNGQGFLAQKLVQESEIIETNFVKLNKRVASTTSESLTPFTTNISKLPTGIREIAVKSDSSKIFYYVNGNSSNWFLSNPDGTSATLLISHPLREWLPTWISSNSLLMQQKSSVAAISYAYIFDINSKSLSKVGRGIAGLSVNPKQGGEVSLVSNGGATPQIFLENYETNSFKVVGVDTLAEKCVWLNKETLSAYCAVPNQLSNANYPDNWYQGRVNTEDYLKKVNIKEDLFYNTANLSSESKEKIDVVDMKISPDDSHIIFRNKIDGFLWMLRIEE